MRARRTLRRLTVMALLTLSGCRFCGDAKTVDRPEAYLSYHSQSVVQIPDVGALASRRGAVMSLLDGIATPGQLESAEHQLALVLGFNPATAKGLQEAGLPAKGAAAVEVVDGGRQALWVVPVADAKKFGATLQKVVSSQRKIDATKTENHGKVAITTFNTSWGPKNIPIAAWASRGGKAFVGVGREAPKLVAAALDRSPKGSLLDHPSFKRLDAALPPRALVRMIVPTATAAASGVLGLRGMAIPEELGFARSLQALGWGLKLEGRTLSLVGQMRFDEAGRAQLAKVMKSRGPAPAGVRALHATDASLFVDVAGDPVALLDLVAPPGSKPRQRIERDLGRAREELGVDLQADLLPHLSGHATLALGVNDLSGISNLRAVIANPAALVWSALAVGKSSPKVDRAVEALWPKVEAGLARSGLNKVERKVQGVTVTSVRLPAGGPEATVVESAMANDAWLLSNQVRQTNVALGAAARAPKDPLQGKAGAHVELQFAQLAAAARGLDIGRLAGEGASALMVRAMIAKGLMVLERLARAEISVVAVQDGLQIVGQVEMAPPAPKK